MERLAHDWSNNLFLTDYGTPNNNKPLIDGLNDEDSDTNSHFIDFYTLISNSTQDRTISYLTISSVLSPASSLSASNIR